MAVLNRGMTVRPTEQDHIIAGNYVMVERMIGLEPVGQPITQHPTYFYMVIRC